MFEDARPFLLSLLIGLLIGIERERSTSSDTDKRPLGSRTFTLLALLGAMAGYGDEPAMAAVLAVFAAAIVVGGYLRAADVRLGFTTEVAGMLVFALGYLTHEDAPLAVMLSVLTLAVLASKSQIHHFARAGLRQGELTAAIVVLVLAFVVYPLLPDRYVDPWSLVNPSRLWLIFVIINALSFAGYVAVRLMGPGRGFATWGLMAGLVSSTAATMALGQRAREGAARGPVATGIVLATVASAAAQLLVAGLAAPDLIGPVTPVVLVPILVGLVGTWLAPHLPGWKTAGVANAGEVPLTNPIALRPSAVFAAIIAVVLTASSLAARWIGSSGVIATATIGGAANVHAATLAAATVAASGGITGREAVLAVLGAFLANMVVKLAVTGWIGGRGLLAAVAPPLLAMMTSGVLAYLAMGWVK
jgi:uncharacterized membrane protein (DUF4010 family)